MYKLTILLGINIKKETTESGFLNLHWSVFPSINYTGKLLADPLRLHLHTTKNEIEWYIQLFLCDVPEPWSAHRGSYKPRRFINLSKVQYIKQLDVHVNNILTLETCRNSNKQFSILALANNPTLYALL